MLESAKPFLRPGVRRGGYLLAIACAAALRLPAQPAFDLLPSRGSAGTSVIVRFHKGGYGGNVKFGGVVAELTNYYGENNVVQALVPPGLLLGRVRVTAETVPPSEGVDFEVTGPGPGGGPSGTLSIGLPKLKAFTEAHAVNPVDNTLLTVIGREMLVIDLATGRTLGAVTLDTLDLKSPSRFKVVPTGLAVNPANNTAVAITTGASPPSVALTVIDLAARKVVKSVPLAADTALRVLNGVAIDAATNTAVLRIDGVPGSLLLVNLDTGKLRSIPVSNGVSSIFADIGLRATPVAVNSSTSTAVLVQQGIPVEGGACNLVIVDIPAAAILKVIPLPPYSVSVAINEKTNTAVVIGLGDSAANATNLVLEDLATGSTQILRLKGISGLGDIRIDSGTNVGLLKASSGERIVRAVDLATGFMPAPYSVPRINGIPHVLVNPATHTGVLLLAPDEDGSYQGIVRIYDHATEMVPTITGMVPFTASEGETVAILGYSFGAGAAPVRVSFNGVEGVVFACGRSSILARVPSGVSSGPVTVTVNGVTSAGKPFKVRTTNGPPAITSVSPNQGPVSGGTRVLIKGTNLTAGGGVRIGGAVAAGLEVIDAETIAVFTPPRLPGASDIEIVQNNGMARLAEAFTYSVGHAGKSFVSAGQMTAARGNYPAASLLPDGLILVSGGNSRKSFPIGDEYLTAETFDPSGTRPPRLFKMGEVRGGHTSTALASGKLLVAGGGVRGQSYPYWTAAAEVFDPDSGVFTSVGRMTEPRGLHQSVLLPNGLVLVLGGVKTFAPAFASPSAELFHPASGTFTRTGDMKALRSGATATLLADGRVLVAGGTYTASHGEIAAVSAAEIFDPATGEFHLIADPTVDANAPGQLNKKRAGHSAVLLPSGDILLAGGGGNTGEIFHPETQRFIPVPNQMSAGIHTASSALLLPDGRALFVGGLGPSDPRGGDLRAPPLRFSDIYDPSTGQFAPGPTLVNARAEAPAVLLPDGRVVVLGGVMDYARGLASIEILQ